MPHIIEKLGTIDCDLVETTPVVWRGRLMRFEYVRQRYKPNTTGDSYMRFVDVETGECTPAFGHGHHLGSAHIEGDRVYVYSLGGKWGTSTIYVHWSDDLEHWHTQPALVMDGWELYNNTVCRGPDGYMMSFEAGEPADLIGVRFTNFFARSDDLLNWQYLGPDHVFARDRYTACPAMRFHNGWYYIFYLERVGEGEAEAYETWVVRTRDFRTFEMSPHNPVLRYDDADKQLVAANLDTDRIDAAENRNNSDFDFCAFGGEVIINYSWGDQHGREFLAAARAPGPLGAFMESWFEG
jgi:hypothetical protein